MSDDAVYKLTFVQRSLVLVFVTLATTIYASSILIASALLPQMQGALGATQDEVSWTMTFNIVATAVVTPMTGWIADRFGRRATMVWCAMIFAFATFMCGVSSSLETLIFWRVIQGAAGAPLVPLGQTILLDAYPRKSHASIMAIYGMANMFGPVLGPTVGGEIAEHYGWRWGYWMIVPVALVTAIGFRAILPLRASRERPSLDWSGLITLSIAIAGAQFVFSRGQRLDWFQSSEIVIVTFITVVAFYMFFAHSLTAERPFIRLYLMKDRNYSLGLLLVFLFGMLNFAPVVLLPPLLQNFASYPDSAIGTFIGWRGAGTALGFLIAMFTSRIDPRLMMMVGFGLQAYGGFGMMQFDLNVGQTELAIYSVIQGAGIGVSWVPLTVVTFATLAPEHRAEGMSMFHLLRNFGSSLFISIAVAEIVRSTGANYARMMENVSPYNRVWNMPWSTGSWTIESIEGMAKFAGEVTRQAAMLGYVNAFAMYTLIGAIAIPVCLFARLPKNDAAAA